MPHRRDVYKRQVPVAAVLFHKLPVEGKKVACVISGGNIDVNILNRVITRGDVYKRQVLYYCFSMLNP